MAALAGKPARVGFSAVVHLSERIGIKCNLSALFMYSQALHTYYYSKITLYNQDLIGIIFT
jgi:hypothetical protein